VKGCVEAALEALGTLDSATFDHGGPPPLRRDRSATVRVAGAVVGFVGELGPRALAKYGLETATALFELRADRLAADAALDGKYRPVPRHPAIQRDIAWVVDESITWADIELAIRGKAGLLLTSAQPFDIYRGGQVPSGSKSVAIRLELRAPDRTLTGQEADECVARILESLELATSGTLRK
jgi:phenylalanyl-tRNA synthetase beta chain